MKEFVPAGNESRCQFCHSWVAGLAAERDGYRANPLALALKHSGDGLSRGDRP